MSKVQTLLKHAGLRKTPCRTQVLNLLLKETRAISQAEFEQHLEDIDRVTIYRTLQTFEDKGLLHKVIDGQNQSKFALCSHECDAHNHRDEHIHFHCERCDKTRCMDELGIPTILLPNGYVARSANYVIDGLCGDCNAVRR